MPWGFVGALQLNPAFAEAACRPRFHQSTPRMDPGSGDSAIRNPKLLQAVSFWKSHMLRVGHVILMCGCMAGLPQGSLSVVLTTP
jgi:hypothetical protein